MPKKGFKSLTVNEEVYNRFYDWYLLHKKQNDQDNRPGHLHTATQYQVFHTESFAAFVESALDWKLNEEKRSKEISAIINPDKIPKPFLYDDGRIRPVVFNEKYQCYIVDRSDGYE